MSPKLEIKFAIQLRPLLPLRLYSLAKNDFSMGVCLIEFSTHKGLVTTFQMLIWVQPTIRMKTMLTHFHSEAVWSRD